MKLKRNIALSESGFVYDPSTGESYSLNEQGIEILRLLQEEKSFPEISSTMVGQYEVNGVDFEKYYFDFLGMLRQFRLLEDERQD